jgi:DNA-binding CsgD family transcriptional regulator
MLTFHENRYRSTATIRNEETELDLTMAFLDATSGHSHMDNMLERLGRSLGAEAVMISRGDAGNDASRTLARSCGRFLVAHRDGLVREILGPLYFRMRPGAACFASEHLAAVGPGGAAVRELLSERGLVEVALVVLECNSNAADYLELHFSCQLDDDLVQRLDGLGRALSRIWQLAGSKFDMKETPTSGVRQRGKGISASPSILDVRNPAGLTRAEFRICLLLNRGLSTSAVARELDVSLTTVRTHLRNIYRKTEVSGIGELSYRLVSRADRISETLSFPLSA